MVPERGCSLTLAGGESRCERQCSAPRTLVQLAQPYCATLLPSQTDTDAFFTAARELYEVSRQLKRFG